MTVKSSDPFSPDVLKEKCPTRLVLSHLADKWALLLLHCLSHKSMRFNQLHREIQGISHKVLSHALKKLERDGLIDRQVFATVPVTVEYSITKLGSTLSSTVAMLTLWAETHIDTVIQNQQRYDARTIEDE